MRINRLEVQNFKKLASQTFDFHCVPGADDLWFDSDRDQIVLSIDGNPQPLENLSAGQRVMLAMVADIAIKAITQNAFLLPPDDLSPEDDPLPRVLSRTPGVVLIDELDVHLHPGWQRRVATDLKRTFPSIQFICTSHSPQVIGEVARDEVRLFHAGGVSRPAVAFDLARSKLRDLRGLLRARARGRGPAANTLRDNRRPVSCRHAGPCALSRQERGRP